MPKSISLTKGAQVVTIMLAGLMSLFRVQELGLEQKIGAKKTTTSSNQKDGLTVVMVAEYAMHEHETEGERGMSAVAAGRRAIIKQQLSQVTQGLESSSSFLLSKSAGLTLLSQVRPRNKQTQTCPSKACRCVYFLATCLHATCHSQGQTPRIRSTTH